MASNLAILNTVLKDIYEGSLRKQLNDETLALARIEKTSKGTTNDAGGKGAVFPIHTRRNTGLGARREMELLPTPGQQGTAAARVTLKYLYGGMQLTGQAIKLANTNYQSFISALELETNGLKTDLAVDMNRQVYGDGIGTLGTVVSGTGGADNNVFVVNEAKFFQEGMLVDVFPAGATTAGAVVAAGRTVLSVNVDTNTVIVSGASITAAAGQFFTRAGNISREWTGLKAIVSDTGVLYGIDPAVESVWKSSVDANSGTGRAVSEGLFTLMTDRIRTKGGGTPTVVFTSLGVRREYAALLMQQRTYVNTTEFTGGFKGIAFTTDNGDIPIISDKDAPKGTAYFLNEKHLKVYRESDWSWMDEDGNKFARVPGYDAYSATMYQYSELATDRRNAHGVIRDLIES